MNKRTFGDLDVGERFKFNLMYWQKIPPKSATLDEGAMINVNAKFLSDDHYENEKTDVYIGGSDVRFEDHIEVVPFTGDTRREQVLAEMETAI